ncbi:MAG: hypothetical protein IRZ07_31050, partial [Microbispora sp.]|nr:hypothetical protein [Microbispora sp.]
PAPAPAARTTGAWRLAVVAALVVVVGLAAGLGAWLLVSGQQGGSGRYTAVPDACRSLTGAQIRELLGASVKGEPAAGGRCVWNEHVTGRDGEITVGYRLPADGEGVDAASQELAAERTARCTAARDLQGIADEAFACDTPDPAAGTTGATVWFRLSNLIVEVAYRRAGDPSVTPADRRTAERAAELVGIGLG